MASTQGRRNPAWRGWLQALSDRECARFRNRNLRQPERRRRVHAVEYRDWLGVPMPTPACNQALNPLALAGITKAVTEPVNCERCLAIRGTAVTPLAAIDGEPEQPPLPFDSATGPEDDLGEHGGGPRPQGA